MLMIDPNSGAALQNGVTVTVTVSPSSAAVRAGRIQPFTATVVGAPNAVTWSVNGAVGGDVVVGTIDANGQYLAPTLVPSPATVTVRAASTSSPTASGSAAVTILPLPAISTVTPSPVPVGSFTLTVNGTGFIAGSTVSFDGAALATTVLSATQLRATGNATAAKASVPVVVSSPDGAVSNTVTVDITAPVAIAITISPTTATVKTRGTKQFTATVQHAANTSVIWKVNGISGGNASIGTITASGLYRAPTAVPNPAIVTVSATAVADTTKTASAAVKVSRR